MAVWDSGEYSPRSVVGREKVMQQLLEREAQEVKTRELRITRLRIEAFRVELNAALRKLSVESKLSRRIK